MIILASKSPRRSEILRNLGIEFTVFTTDADENLDESLPPSEYVAIIAKRKAAAAVNSRLSVNSGDTTIIAADTTVYIDGKILGKPESKEDAFNMIKLLEGKWHSVYTGLCVAFIENCNVTYIEECVKTNVLFKPLSNAQIESYINTDEPYDKAGSYAIQGEGSKLIARIDGDYTNVVGLPAENLLRILNECNRKRSG
ncbi:MAG: Maf family protein [Lachnospiraceae bacterium]|nr:Maf family protein [Lachnospiraceae bacterium]